MTNAARPIELRVSLPTQQLHVQVNRSVAGSWPVSTSRFGAGCAVGSRKTPTGLHVISEVIGRGNPPTTEFVGRRPIHGESARPPISRIVARILVLRGLEPGVNCGGGNDTERRLIYIHGTPDPTVIGVPRSSGCVLMQVPDVIELADIVEAGTLVRIVVGP